MNKFYQRTAIPVLLSAVFIFHEPDAFSQQQKRPAHRDQADLIAFVQKVSNDHHTIAAVRKKIKESRQANNRKDLKIHREKLVLEKNILQKDYSRARQEENLYLTYKSKKISFLEHKLKASNEKYASLRKKAKKDLAKKNDFALQKDASDLLKAVQARNETYTDLSMEKSELASTREALDREWKNVKSGTGWQVINFEATPVENSLSTVK